MHIVYVIAPGGGPEAYVNTLLPWLLEQGHSVSIAYTARPGNGSAAVWPQARTVFASPGHAHYYVSKVVGGFRAWPLRVRAWESARAVYRAIHMLDQAAPVDAVEVTEGLPVDLLRRRWAIVVRAHGSDWTFRHFCQDGDSAHDGWLVRSESTQLRKAHSASAISRHLASHLSASCDVPENRIEVIPYPVDTRQFCPNDSVNGNGHALALTTIGRLERRKGVDLLLMAMRSVWVRFPQTVVYFAGSEGDLTQAQLRALVPSDKQGQIVFLGFVPRERLPDLYRRTAVYVAPTQYETFGYTILEAMACGLPVIASGAGATPELVGPEKTGLLVPPSDARALATAIERLLKNGAEREAMGRSGREKALAYALDPVCRRMKGLYEQAVAARRAEAAGTRWG